MISQSVHTHCVHLYARCGVSRYMLNEGGMWNKIAKVEIYMSGVDSRAICRIHGMCIAMRTFQPGVP